MSTPRKFIAYFDGCCEPVNPGGAMGFGSIVTENGQAIWYANGMSRADRANSNNVAEYTGLLALLDYLIEAGLADADIEVRGDSQLVIKQMAGEWKIGSGLYAQAAHNARELRSKFTNIRFRWIPRAENGLADELSKEELVNAGIEMRQPA
jgi:ribonuclease HI